jgi:RNA polymerase sigma-70 factor (ECF subfamily)
VDLADAFEAAGGRAEGDRLDLQSTLFLLCARGRLAHPELAMSDEAFAAHLGKIVAASESAPSLEELMIEDLFLAAACAAAVAGAAEAFDARCAGKITAALAATVRVEDVRAEVAQRVREAVLVGSVEGPAKIANYSGQGPLDRWVAVVAQRMAVRLVRGETAAKKVHERAAVEAGIGNAQAPESVFVKERYRGDFERALGEALEVLDGRDRVVMRLHLVSGLGVEAIGKMYGVSHSTVSRWLASARDSVSTEVQRLLGDRLNLARSEVASMAGLVASQLDLSLSRILAGPEKP